MRRIITSLILFTVVLAVSVNIAAAAVTTYSYAGAPVAITDNNTFTATSSVTDSATINDLDVTLNISHSWVGDLSVSLTSPMGTTVVIVDRPGNPGSPFGCSSDNITTTIDDEAGSAVETACPPTGGSYTSNNPLSAFDGQDVNGTWTLTVSDNAGGDTGTINGWSLVVDGAAIVVPPAPSAPVVVPALIVPVIRDGRDNLYDLAAPAVIYCVSGAINIYDNVDSVGVIVINATQAEIDAVGVPQDANALIEASSDGTIRLYRLTTGEFQVNADEYNVADTYIFTWTATCISDGTQSDAK